MGGFTEYDNYDATALAALVKKGDVTPEEIVEQAISKVEELNPKLNAVIHKMYDVARDACTQDIPEGPFSGVPFLLKDLLAAFDGQPLRNGCKAYRNYVPDHDSEMVKRFKKAGLVVVGKTSTPEFGLLGYTEPELFGPCRNPWNTDHTPGGSSGGSASAVAAGIVPMASAGDGGGSIRIPAACCGLFGIKPTRGRNPTGPDYGEIWQGAVVEHVVSRSVRDSAAALDAIHGADPGAPYFAPPPERPFLKEVSARPGKLKIAFDTKSPIGLRVDPECVKAVEDTAALLEELGHEVVETRPAIDGQMVAKSYFMMVYGEVAADVAEVEQKFGKRAARNSVELGTRSLALMGRAISAGDFVLAKRNWNRISRAMGNFFEDFDLYVTPTLAMPPIKVGSLAIKPHEELLSNILNNLEAGKFLKATGMLEKIAIENLEPYPFTQLANITGMPAMSVPLHWTPDNLPCGVQFAARLGGEPTLFRIAAQLEKARPWFNKRPPVK